VANRDRFVLSCGHASMLLYASLYLCGYGLELGDLESFRQIGSPCAGHPSTAPPPASRRTTGPLGQGISTCVGLALAERVLAARFNRDGHQVIDHHTFTIVSDGDMEEGLQSEAASLAGHLGLGRLIAFYDDNHISIEGDTELAFTRTSAALRGLRLARAAPRRGHRGQPPRRGGARRDGRRGTAVADHLPHAHRLRRAEQAGSASAHGSRSARRRSG